MTSHREESQHCIAALQVKEEMDCRVLTCKAVFLCWAMRCWSGFLDSPLYYKCMSTSHCTELHIQWGWLAFRCYILRVKQFLLVLWVGSVEQKSFSDTPSMYGTTIFYKFRVLFHEIDLRLCPDTAVRVTRSMYNTPRVSFASQCLHPHPWQRTLGKDRKNMMTNTGW